MLESEAINTNQPSRPAAGARESETMDALAFDLKNLTARSGEGSFATRANRANGLQLIARELKALGYKIQSAHALKPKHVEALVTHWKTRELGDATVKNRLGWLRWWAAAVRKSSVITGDNGDYGIADRPMYRGNRAKPLDRERLTKIPDKSIQFALRLQQAFGLRREEALKFRPREADRGDHIALKPSWTKGGRARLVPITDPRQRALLDEVHRFSGDGSLIPQGKSYRDHLKTYDNLTARAGLKNNHGLRHWYAQWRYRTLTGVQAPAATAGEAPALSRSIDVAARRQISQELGHNRIDITDTYLGRRPGGAGTA